MRAYFLLLTIILMMASCQKDTSGIRKPDPKNIGEDSGCINRVYRHPGNDGVPAANFAEALALLGRNNLQSDNLRIFSFSSDSISQDNGTSGLKTQLFQSIDAQIFVNGLAVLNMENEIFSFIDSQLTFTNVHKLTTMLDTVAALNIAQVRKLASDRLMEDKNPLIRAYKDSCLTAEFGYYDLSRGNGAVKIIKAWSVSLGRAELMVIADAGVIVMYEAGGVFIL